MQCGESCSRLGTTNPLLPGRREQGAWAVGVSRWGRIGRQFAFVCKAVLCASASYFSAVDVLSGSSATRCQGDLKELSGRIERCQWMWGIWCFLKSEICAPLSGGLGCGKIAMLGCRDYSLTTCFPFLDLNNLMLFAICGCQAALTCFRSTCWKQCCC